MSSDKLIGNLHLSSHAAACQQHFHLVISQLVSYTAKQLPIMSLPCFTCCHATVTCQCRTPAAEVSGAPELESFLEDCTAGVPVTLERLEALFPFTLDSFQKKAVQQLLNGKSVVVCAPTGES